MLKYAILALIQVSAINIDGELPDDSSNLSLTTGTRATLGITSENFAEAAVAARIAADQESGDGWKDHFTKSEFFQNYSQFESKRKDCHGKCEKNQKALAKLKFDYIKLVQKYEALDAKAQ